MTDLIALAVSCMTDKPSPGPSVILCHESLQAFADLIRQDERGEILALSKALGLLGEFVPAAAIRARTTI